MAHRKSYADMTDEELAAIVLRAAEWTGGVQGEQVEHIGWIWAWA